jgi:3-isopropylmalate/(R)-2-methylmalate dehydratase small subunit
MTDERSAIISHITGRALPLRGDDIDTDRIMPARFLRVVSFEGLERHVFEDDRAADAQHPFNDPRYRNASVLVANANFGCGSSREHAPQGLARAGIRALIAESFSEIFRGNAAMIGVPCLTADRTAITRLQTLVEASPATPIEIDVASGRVRAGGFEFEGALPPALQDAFLSGQWNPTAMLLADFDAVRRVAGRLPYLAGF